MLSLLCLPVAPAVLFDSTYNIYQPIFFFLVQLLLCCIVVNFSVPKHPIALLLKDASPPPGAQEESPLGVWVGEEKQEAAPSLRGECGQGVNQRNAKCRRMISHCPAQGTGFLSFSVNESLAARGEVA